MADPNTMNDTPAEVRAQCEQFRASFAQLRTEIGKVMVGQLPVVDAVLVCLFSGGNVLLEGVPGIGKTLLVRTLANAVRLPFNRIQFTPDLMPADIIGTNIVKSPRTPTAGRRRFEFQRGPIFNQVVLADEINRATPKTQSALLEAMQERSVTVGGVTYKLQAPSSSSPPRTPSSRRAPTPCPRPSSTAS
jgi:MoxR-like ATPase